MRFAAIMDACLVLPWRIIHTAMLGGGALRSFFDGTMVKDYDLFFETAEEWAEAYSLLGADPAFAFQAGTAGTLYPTFVHIYTGRLFNLIGFRFADSPKALAESFDFRCCGMAFRLRHPEMSFYGVEGADTDCFKKELNFLNLQPTHRVARRLRRYVDELGYSPTGDFIDRLVECSMVTNTGCSYPTE